MLFTDKAHGNFAKDPAVVKFHDMYYLYYSLKYEDDRFGVGIATSTAPDAARIIFINKIMLKY